MKEIKVGELIEELKKYNSDLVVNVRVDYSVGNLHEIYEENGEVILIG